MKEIKAGIPDNLAIMGPGCHCACEGDPPAAPNFQMQFTGIINEGCACSCQPVLNESWFWGAQTAP